MGWTPELREYIDSLKQPEKWGGKPYSSRYAGSHPPSLSPTACCCCCSGLAVALCRSGEGSKMHAQAHGVRSTSCPWTPGLPRALIMMQPVAAALNAQLQPMQASLPSPHRHRHPCTSSQSHSPCQPVIFT